MMRRWNGPPLLKFAVSNGGTFMALPTGRRTFMLEPVPRSGSSKELPWPGGPPNLMKTKISVPPAQNRARQQADAFGAGTVMASSGERTQILGGTTMRDRIDQNFRNETFELNPR